MEFPVEKIETMIYTIRGQRVMLDSDLAKLYRVQTKRLIEQVKRNPKRFPIDFVGEPNSGEGEDLRSKVETANPLTSWNHKRRNMPLLFTENGVAMLSSVLNSNYAIEINVTIMRTFTKLRSFLAMDNSLESRVGKLEDETNQLFKVVFEKLDHVDNRLAVYEEAIVPKLPSNRKKIGLKTALVINPSPATNAGT